MNPETASFMKEVEKIEDAQELRLFLAALKEANRLLQNRESERLRAENEMSLLFRQMEEELKGLRKENAALKKENAELREKLEKASSDNTLKKNTIFGRSTEKTADLLEQAENGTSTEDPLAEEMPEESAEENENASARRKPHGKRPKGKRKEDLSKLPRQVTYEYDEKCCPAS